MSSLRVAERLQREEMLASSLSSSSCNLVKEPAISPKELFTRLITQARALPEEDFRLPKPYANVYFARCIAPWRRIPVAPSAVSAQSLSGVKSEPRKKSVVQIPRVKGKFAKMNPPIDYSTPTSRSDISLPLFAPILDIKTEIKEEPEDEHTYSPSPAPPLSSQSQIKNESNGYYNSSTKEEKLEETSKPPDPALPLSCRSEIKRKSYLYYDSTTKQHTMIPESKVFTNDALIAILQGGSMGNGNVVGSDVSTASHSISSTSTIPAYAPTPPFVQYQESINDGHSNRIKPAVDFRVLSMAQLHSMRRTEEAIKISASMRMTEAQEGKIAARNKKGGKRSSNVKKVKEEDIDDYEMEYNGQENATLDPEAGLPPRIIVIGQEPGTLLAWDEEEIIILRPGETPEMRPPRMKRHSQYSYNVCTSNEREPPTMGNTWQASINESPDSSRDNSDTDWTMPVLTREKKQRKRKGGVVKRSIARTKDNGKPYMESPNLQYTPLHSINLKFTLNKVQDLC